ncbi:MAG TPA: amidase [Candidatus Eisenbacteria bacterium]|nr:amidase [Candidatus Eisenbacteria bacterium]
MLTIAEASEQLRSGKLSSFDLTRACLERIGKLDPELNAFITVTADLAVRQAQQADREIAAGQWRGPLHGIPVALKDLVDVAGVRTTGASNQLRHHIADSDAAIVARLKAAGGVIVGKTNLHEFAFGGSGMVSAFGPTRNPWNVTRITGGSSSGSAAAVASGMCVAAIGTDTAGSVRDPAALCGIVGHRPSAGVWSTDGIIPLRKSFDTVGPMTRTVEDAWLMFGALPGNNQPAPLVTNLEHARIGIARQGFFDAVDDEIEECVEEAIKLIRPMVASEREVKVEVGVKWTDFDAEILEYHRPMLAHSPELYRPDTLDRLRACAAIPTAEFEAALTGLSAARKQNERIFDLVDVVLTPTCLVEAPRISDLQAMTAHELRTYEVQKLLRNTAPFSLLFWPSVSVPCGFTSQGLPVGLHISARPGADEFALRVARAYEEATEWHKRVPAIGA